MPDSQIDSKEEMSNVSVNGVRLTVSELAAWRRKNSHANHARFIRMVESRKAPGGHAPYWGVGHESLSCAVPASQAKEHHDWCRDQGLSGVEVKSDGTVVTSSPMNKDKYLQARGLIDANTAGSDTKCLRDKQAVVSAPKSVRIKRSVRNKGR